MDSPKPFLTKSKLAVFAGLVITGVLVAVAIVASGVVNSDWAFTYGTRTGVATAPASGYGLATALKDVAPADLDKQLTDMKATGVTWVRYDLSWKLVQPDNANSYDWSNYDRITKAATAHGFRVLMIIDFSPAWAQAAGCSGGAALCAPANPIAYAKFAAAAAAHYQPYGVEDWEIWNEPNTAFRFEPKADPALYTRMLKDSYAAIKRVDSKAVVITGGTSPAATDGTDYSPPDFLKALYANGAAGWFDAAAAHPYTYPTDPANAKSIDAWGQLSQMHALMVAHGDGNKQIWATEFGAPTNGPDPSKFVSEADQAKTATDAVNLYHSYSWAGPFIWYNYTDTGTTTDTNENFFGLIRADGSHKPAYDAFVKAIANAK